MALRSASRSSAQVNSNVRSSAPFAFEKREILSEPKGRPAAVVFASGGDSSPIPI